MLDAQNHDAKTIAAKKSRAGRKSLAEKDAPLVEKALRMIASGEADSAHAAAVKIAHRAEGTGTEESKISRIAGRIRIRQAEVLAPSKGLAFHAAHSTSQVKIGGYETACTIILTNVAMPPRRMVGCFLQLEQMTGLRADGMPSLFNLRTERQICGRRRGRWRLSPMQPESIPIVFRDPVRKNEWFFIDENGKRYHKAARSMKMVLGVYGGDQSAKFLVQVHVGAGSNWTPESSIEAVPDDYVLESKPDPWKAFHHCIDVT